MLSNNPYDREMAAAPIPHPPHPQQHFTMPHPPSMSEMEATMAYEGEHDMRPYTTRDNIGAPPRAPPFHRAPGVDVRPVPLSGRRQRRQLIKDKKVAKAVRPLSEPAASSYGEDIN